MLQESPMPLCLNNSGTEIYCRHILFGLDLALLLIWPKSCKEWYSPNWNNIFQVRQGLESIPPMILKYSLDGEVSDRICFNGVIF